MLTGLLPASAQPASVHSLGPRAQGQPPQGARCSSIQTKEEAPAEPCMLPGSLREALLTELSLPVCLVCVRLKPSS